jgi:hypothetical protein
MEAFAVASHHRAQAAWDNGWFDAEVAPMAELAQDETIRPQTNMEGLAGLRTVQEGGMITAGISSQNCDGAAAMLVASERAVKEHGLKPRGRADACEHELCVTWDSGSKFLEHSTWFAWLKDLCSHGRRAQAERRGPQASCDYIEPWRGANSRSPAPDAYVPDRS